MRHEVRTSPGEHIRTATERLAAEAAQHGPSFAVFNDIEIEADRSSTPAGLLAQWDQKLEAARTAYRNSPEGQQAEREREQRRSDLQAQHDALMRKLPTLDFTDQLAVLDWLCAMQDPSDHVGVIKRRHTTIATFKRHGYEPGVNCGSDFKKGDRDNEFRWLVGQALSTLETCAIHGIIHKFAADWKAQYLAPAGGRQ